MSNVIARIAKLTADVAPAAIILIAVIASSAATHAYAEKRQRESFEDNARTSIDRILRQANCVDGKRLSLGLWTIPDDRSPVGPSATKRIYDEVLSRLLQRRPRCVDVIDSAGIGVVIDHLHKSGALEQNGGDVLAALSEAHQNVEFVVFPDLFAQSGKVLLTLRIVERASGRTLDATSPLELPKGLTQDGSTDQALSLDSAIKLAADQLAQSAPDLKEIQTGGVFFEATEAQPPAGRFIQEQLVAALVERGSNILTQKQIRVRGISLAPADPESVKANELDSQSVARSENIYDLNGRYWVRKDALDLRISLARPDGATSGWRGRIRLSDLNGMELRPQNPASLGSPLPKAGYAFQVTTTKGIAPTQRVGDDLQLLIRVGREAWIYCFYVDSKGQVLPIFPRPRDLVLGRFNKIEPNKLVRFPEPSRDNFRLRFNSDTVGEELVSCYAADRNLQTRLPPALLPERLTIVPFLTLDKLRQTFRDMHDAKIAESLVTITVLP